MILKALGKTAIKWLLIALAFVLILSAINYGASFIPFTPQWSAKRAVVRVRALEGQVSTLEREATGNAEISRATERHFEREVIIREATAQAITDARTAPDATTPLSDERANRLRSHDIRLCSQFPSICADPDAAGRGPDALSPPDPAR